MTPLERRCRWLLLTYPAWYRRRRGEEMLGTLLEASPPGRRWPSIRDARALILGGLRVRGWVWLLSMLWVVAGAGGAGYFFYITTKPYTWADVDLGIVGWSADPQAVQIAALLAIVAWLALPVPVLIAGFIRLRAHAPGQCLGNIPREPRLPLCRYASHWKPCRGELGRAGDLCRVAGARRRADLDPGRARVHRSDVPDTSSRASDEASRRPPSVRDLQT